MNKQTEGKPSAQKHELHLLQRNELRLCDVEEVLSFDEEGVKLQTFCGEMLVEGKDLHIDVLDTEHGMLSLTGRIDGVFYCEETVKKGSGQWFGKLFR